jgi:hypothetical protein
VKPAKLVCWDKPLLDEGGHEAEPETIRGISDIHLSAALQFEHALYL